MTATSARGRRRSTCRELALAAGALATGALAATALAACSNHAESRPRLDAKETRMTVRQLWAGPSQLPEGVTVVTERARWDAVRAAWDEPLRAKVGDPDVDWTREVVVIVAGAETS